MYEHSKNIQPDFLGQTFWDLLQFKTRSLLLGHPVYAYSISVFISNIKAKISRCVLLM